jgi:hypothetical protein
MGDSIVNSIVQKFLSRSDVGIKKYGTTLDRNDLTTIDWITHAQEELMDGILYLEKLKVLEQTKLIEQCNKEQKEDCSKLFKILNDRK